VAELLWLWDNRNHVYERLYELPRTFCHNDLHNRNLFVRGGSRPDCVAIDWALCRGGVVGQELSAMIGATVIFRGSRPEDGDELEDVCLSAYTAGLRDTCEADPSQARLGYLLSIGLRFGLGSIPALLALTTDHQDADLIRRLFECSYEEWIVHSAQAMDFMAKRIRRVREELGSPRT
jgi:hypothetical protein